MSASMAGAATSIEGSLSAAELAAVTAAEAALTQWAGAASGMSSDMAGAASAVEDEYKGMGNSAELAAAAASDAWLASQAELTSKMALTGEAVDAEFAGMATTAEVASSKLQSSISSLGGKAMSTGFMAGIAGTLGLGVIKNAVTDASDDMNSLAQMGHAVQTSFANSGSGASGAATEIKTLTDQINSLKASQDVAEAALQKWTGTTAQVAAAHAKASAEIATYQDQIDKVTGKLQELQNGNTLVGGSADQVTAALTGVANGAVNMGFTVSDSADALKVLWSNTQDSTQAQQAFQDAMDLSRAASIPLTQAANDVVQAMQGNGKALRDVNVQVQDGLSGQQALAAIMQQVGGSAATYASGPLGQLNIATAQLNATMASAGKTIIPILADLAKGLDGFLKGIDAFITAHPKVTEGLLLIWGGFSALLLILAPFLITFGVIVQLLELLDTLSEIKFFSAIGSGFSGIISGGKMVVTFLSETLMSAFAGVSTFVTETLLPTLLGLAEGIATTVLTALTGFADLIMTTVVPALWAMAAAILADPLTWIILAIILVVAAMVLLGYEIYKNWDLIKQYFSEALTYIKNLWNDIWTGLWSFLGDIWTEIGAAVQKGINFIEGIINGFATTVQNIYKTIMAPINAITGAVSAVSGAVGGAVGTAIKAFASGGIVNGPTLALVGEAGPEAIIPLSAFNGGSSLGGGGFSGGGSGNINVYIQGGNYLDSTGATMIANALATQIQRQLRLKNYA